ncbi:GntR family transcriptional regulator [Actinopolymorpha sp. B9G3]|uniref:GntR family transcriptional regulator n=1 Tax=Actinopolymorpha sp. B9G3 TaxID=3158970 RepID=UPI0032D91725
MPEVNVLDEGSPLFVQIAEQIADDIAEGNLAEGERVPSTNELAAYYRINPATAAKGINVLIDDGLLEKRRGIGMFVAPGARERLVTERRKRFAELYIDRMLIEARRLGIDDDTLVSMVRDASNSRGASTGTGASTTTGASSSHSASRSDSASHTTGGGTA